MSKQLVFDTTDATSIAHSDSVGAYVRSSDGTLITHTTVGGKEALDVRVAEGINVEVDLSHVDDSVRLGDGTTLFTGTTVGADTGLDVNIINANIEVTQGTSPWVIGDGGGSITVDATDLDIRDLTAVSDSVASHMFDGAGTALTSTLVGADQALDVNIVNEISVNDAALANTAIANAAATLAVAGTAQDAVASPLANRKYLYIRNQDNKNIFIGSTGVTAANGFPVSPGMVIEMRAGASVDIEFVGSTGATPEIRTLELS